MGMPPALKIFEDAISELKKQVEGIRKKLKAAVPGPGSADILNRYVGKKATIALRNGQTIAGTLLEHDRYNCLVETEQGQVVLLKHAVDSITPTE